MMGIKAFFLAKVKPKMTVVLHANCHTLDHVPGKKTIASLGIIQCRGDLAFGKHKNEIEDMITLLYESAVQHGANAIINLQITTGSYPKNAAGLAVNYVMAHGEAVIVE